MGCHGNLLEGPRNPTLLAVVQHHEEGEGQRSSTAVVEVAGLPLEVVKMLQFPEGVEPKGLEEIRYVQVQVLYDVDMVALYTLL